MRYCLALLGGDGLVDGSLNGAGTLEHTRLLPLIAGRKLTFGR